MTEQNPPPKEQNGQTVVEKVEIAGNQLVDRVKDLVKESNTRSVVIRKGDGEELMTVPLTVGVVAGGIVTLAAPLVAALGVVAALSTHVKLDVVREVDVPEDNPTEEFDHSEKDTVS
jgi:hypothetical protein